MIVFLGVETSTDMLIYRKPRKTDLFDAGGYAAWWFILTYNGLYSVYRLIIVQG